MKIGPVLKYLLLVATGLALVSAIIVIGGHSPLQAAASLLKGSLGSTSAINGTLKEFCPLLVLGCAVFIALKSGLFNIGAEGQFAIGGCAAAAVSVQLPGAIGVLLGSLAGILAGALWAFPAGYIRAYRGGHEVITTIMLNIVAGHLTKLLVSGPLRGKDQQGTASTSMLPKESYLGKFSVGPIGIYYELIVGILLVVGLYLYLKHTKSGYELRATGANMTAARMAGIKVKPMMLSGMCASGAIAGLAGAMQLFQFDHRFYDGFATGYGFDALGVALLAGNNPLLLFGSAGFFGVLWKGGTALNASGIDKSITLVALAVIIVAFAAYKSRRLKHEEH